MTFAERAGILLELGFPVIPVLPRQKAAFKNDWQNLATLDRDVIAQWNKENPNFNTGAVGKLDIGLILDIDSGEIFQQLKRAGIELDSVHTFQVAGGKPSPCGHYYFLHTERSRALGNCYKAVYSRATGKQIRTEFELGGNNYYVVGPGSIHPNGKQYTIVENSPPIPIPDALVDWIERNRFAVYEGEGPHGPAEEKTPGVNGTNGHAPRRPGTFRERIKAIIVDCQGKSYEEIKTILAQYGYAHRHEADSALAEFLFLEFKGDEEKIREEFARLKLHQDRNSSYDRLTIAKARSWYENEVLEQREVSDQQPKLLLTHQRLAERFVDIYQGELRYVARWGRWMMYAPPRWRKDSTLNVFDRARHICRLASAELNQQQTGKISHLETTQMAVAVETLSWLSVKWRRAFVC
jgi:hypothetical protein